MAYSITPEIGVDVANPLLGSVLFTNGSVTISGGQTNIIPPYKLGTQVWGSDGKRYVFCSIAPGSNITTGLATCSVSTTTFAATATGGSYVAPTFTISGVTNLGNTGNLYSDYGWFAAASV
jgi:hypothetical protein